MKASPIITSLNAGEFSPLMAGRSDIGKYANACKLLQNFLPTVQGPIVRRGGTRYVATKKSPTTRGWLLRFEYSATQAWVLEFGDGYVRFYTNHGQVVVAGVAAYAGGTAYVLGDLVLEAGVHYYCIAATTGNAPPNATYWYPLTGTIYEIPSPYAVADLTNADGTCALKVVQSGDVLYLANQKRTYAPRKLTRYGSTNWQFSTYQPNQGPFLEMNTTTTTIYASAKTGSVTLTASAAVFASTDVGRLVRLEVQDLDVEPWETGKAYLLADLVRYDGKTYRCSANATSGTSPPIHEQGKAYDGKGGVHWEYQDAGYGIARITAFTSATAVTASVVVDAPNGLNQYPAGVVGSGNPTKRWNLGAWSATTEYPATVAFWSDRLWWGGRQRYWASVSNDYENMAGDLFGEVRADTAIWRQLQAEDVNDILWMVGAQRLVIGTPGGEFIVSKLTTNEPLGPANIEHTRQSKRRVRSVQPIAVGEKLIYTQRAGRKLLAMGYSIETDTFNSIDLAVLADRMTRAGIVDVAFQSEPYSILWCVLSGGKLVAFTYDHEQDVTGWHRHPIGGTSVQVESAVTIPRTDGLGDELWLLVRRTVAGQTVRYVEYMERPWEGPDNDGSGGDDQADAFYVDAGLTYDGVPADLMTGLDHLEGETVQVLADGATHPDRTVVGGAITLEAEASVVHVGLACPARMVTVDLETGAQSGSSAAKAARVYRAGVRFVDTLGGFLGIPAEDLTEPSTLDEIDFRTPADAMDAAPPIMSGVVDVVFPGDWSREKRIEVYQSDPLPMTVANIMPRIHVNDR